MNSKDYSFIKAPNWDRDEEQRLFTYVLAHGIVDNCIDWSGIG